MEVAAFPAPCERADIWSCPRAGAGLPTAHGERCRRNLPALTEGICQPLVHLTQAVRLSRIRSGGSRGTDHPNAACVPEPAAAGQLCGHQSQLGTATCVGFLPILCPSSSSSLAPLWSFLAPTLGFPVESSPCDCPAVSVTEPRLKHCTELIFQPVPTALRELEHPLQLYPSPLSCHAKKYHLGGWHIIF